MTENIRSTDEAIEIVSDLAKMPQSAGLTAAEMVLQELHLYGLEKLPSPLLYALAIRLVTENPFGDRIGEVTYPDDL